MIAELESRVESGKRVFVAGVRVYSGRLCLLSCDDDDGEMVPGNEEVIMYFMSNLSCIVCCYRDGFYPSGLYYNTSLRWVG